MTPCAHDSGALQSGGCSLSSALAPASPYLPHSRHCTWMCRCRKAHGLCESGHCTWKCRCREAQGCARAANARHRHHIVLRHISPISTEQSENTSVAPTAPMTWMARLNRVFGIDLSVCQKCGGKLRVIGEVTEPKAIARILEHAKQRGRHERDPRAPPLLLASLFHLQHVRPALSLAAGLAHWTVRSDFGPVACRATTRRLVGLHRHSLHSA